MTTIDSIKEAYHYDYLSLTPKTKPSTVNGMNNAEFLNRLCSYKVGLKMKNIYKFINEGKINDKKLEEECIKELNDIGKGKDDIIKKMDEDFEFSQEVLYEMDWSYEFYSANSEKLETYDKIVNEIIKGNVEKYIKYEKVFILYSDKLNDINKKLNIINN